MFNIHYSIPALIGTLLLSATAPAATFEVFTDRESWESSITNTLTEDFSDDRPTAGLSITSDFGTVADGKWNDILTKGTRSTNSSTTVFNFSSGSNNFGAFFDLLPASKGTGIKLTFLNGNEEVFSGELPDVDTGFWGLASDTPFTQVILSHGSAYFATKETYQLDDLSYGGSNTLARQMSTPAVVPLPASIWMFTSALLGVAVARRGRPVFTV